MLKIKDNVDLKELVKFGFEYVNFTNEYLKVYYQKLFGFIEIVNSKTRGIAIRQDRIIRIKQMDGCDWINANDEFAVKDLIKAGLVERIEEV